MVQLFLGQYQLLSNQWVHKTDYNPLLSGKLSFSHSTVQTSNNVIISKLKNPCSNTLSVLYRARLAVTPCSQSLCYAKLSGACCSFALCTETRIDVLL